MYLILNVFHYVITKFLQKHNTTQNRNHFLSECITRCVQLIEYVPTIFFGLSTLNQFLKNLLFICMVAQFENQFKRLHYLDTKTL